MSELRLKSTGTIKLFENDNTSSVTIASPASLGADRTITLPDADVTLVSGTMATTNGITEIDNWRVTADFSGSTNPISANWERVDSKAAGYLGTGMSVSSGNWTFPSTGFWLVEAYSNLYLATGTSAYNGITIKVTEDAASGATYTEVSLGQSSFVDGSVGQYVNVRSQYILDVTDTANIKFFMGCSFNNSSVNCKGATDNSVTGLNFFRLGDT